MRAVDLQQALRRRDRRLRARSIRAAAPRRRCGHGRAAARARWSSQASKVGSMPSRSSSRSPSSSDSEAGWSVVARITSSTSTQTAPERSDRWSRVTCMISAAGRRQRLQQAVDFLPQRGPRLLLRPAAPEQFREPAAQRGARGGQRHHGEQGARLASGRQDVLAGDRPGFHLADQTQAQHHLSRWTGLRGRAWGPDCRACHHRVINTVSLVSQIG